MNYSKLMILNYKAVKIIDSNYFFLKKVIALFLLSFSLYEGLKYQTYSAKFPALVLII